MGAAQSALPPWCAPPGEPQYPQHIVREIQALAESSETFLKKAHTSQPNEFFFDESLPRIEAALKADYRLGQWVSKLVPRKVSEEQFWSNYWSHCQSILQPYYQSQSFVRPLERVVSPTPLMPVVRANGVTLTHQSPKSNNSHQSLPAQSPLQQPLSAVETDEEDSHSEHPNSLRWGVIARNHVRLEQLMEAFLMANDVELTAFYVVDTSFAPEEPNYPQDTVSFTDAESLIAADFVDVVLIDSPLTDRSSHFNAAVEHHKPVLVSLPAAGSSKEAAELSMKFSKHSIPAFALAPFRCDPRYLYLSGALSKLGTVQTITYQCFNHLQSETLRSEHIHAQLESNAWTSYDFQSNLAFSFASQLFIVIELLLSSPDNVRGDSISINRSKDDSQTIASIASCTFRCCNDAAMGSALFNFCSNEDRDVLEIHGTNGTCRLSLNQAGHMTDQPFELLIHDQDAVSFGLSDEHAVAQALAEYIERVSISITAHKNESIASALSDILVLSLENSLTSLKAADTMLNIATDHENVTSDRDEASSDDAAK